MQNTATLFIKVVPQRVQRSYFLLCDFQPSVTHASAISYVTLTDITQESLQRAIQDMQTLHKAGCISNVTSAAVAKKLQKLSDV